MFHRCRIRKQDWQSNNVTIYQMQYGAIARETSSSTGVRFQQSPHTINFNCELWSLNINKRYQETDTIFFPSNQTLMNPLLNFIYKIQYVYSTFRVYRESSQKHVFQNFHKHLIEALQKPLLHTVVKREKHSIPQD